MPAPTNPGALEAALDELYGVDPDAFVATRKRLAGELRAAGDKAAATSLQSARRPTTAVWALNRLSRDDPELIAEFLERSRELEAAQTGALAGGRDAIRDATRAQRAALAEATDAAIARLGERATDAYRAQILATLQAAGADDAVGTELRQGRLVRELSGATGFPEGPGLTLVPDLKPAEPNVETKTKAKPKPTRGNDPNRAPGAPRGATSRDDAAEETHAEPRRVEREREALERAERWRIEAESSADAARHEADAAEEAAALAHRRVDGLERDLTDARREARVADEHAGRVRREAARLARAATKLRSRRGTTGRDP